ncbi:MAG: hypothetical protein VW715_02300 [Rhodospirillales bacterium]
MTVKKRTTKAKRVELDTDVLYSWLSAVSRTSRDMATRVPDPARNEDSGYYLENMFTIPKEMFLAQKNRLVADSERAKDRVFNSVNIDSFHKFGFFMTPLLFKMMDELTSVMPYLEVFPRLELRSTDRYFNIYKDMEPYTDDLLIPVMDSVIIFHKDSDYASAAISTSGSKAHGTEQYLFRSPLLIHRERSQIQSTSSAETAMKLARKYAKWTPPTKVREYVAFENEHHNILTPVKRKQQTISQSIRGLKGTLNDAFGDDGGNKVLKFLIDSPSVPAEATSLWNKLRHNYVTLVDSAIESSRMCYLRLVPNSDLVSYTLLDFPTADHFMSGDFGPLTDLVRHTFGDKDARLNDALSRADELLNSLNDVDHWRSSVSYYKRLTDTYIEPMSQLPADMMAKIAQLSIDDGDDDSVRRFGIVDVGKKLSSQEFIIYAGSLWGMLVGETE